MRPSPRRATGTSARAGRRVGGVRPRQYPGTYAHGVYNRETTIVGGRPVPNEDLVALPNWLLLQARVDGEELLRLADVEVLEYSHGYDARRALVWRQLRFRDREGRVFSGHSRRFVSMARMHQAAVAWELTAENWSGPMEILSGIDGGVSNRGVARYRQLESRHLNPVSVRTLDPDVIAVEARTRQSGIEVAEAARTRVFRDGTGAGGRSPRAPDRGLRAADPELRRHGGRELPGREVPYPCTPPATAPSTSRSSTRSRACGAIRTSTRP